MANNIRSLVIGLVGQLSIWREFMAGKRRSQDKVGPSVIDKDN